MDTLAAVGSLIITEGANMPALIQASAVTTYQVNPAAPAAPPPDLQASTLPVDTQASPAFLWVVLPACAVAVTEAVQFEAGPTDGKEEKTTGASRAQPPWWTYWAAGW